MMPMNWAKNNYGGAKSAQVMPYLFPLATYDAPGIGCSRIRHVYLYLASINM